MDIPNAFIGKKEKPTKAELNGALGEAAPVWDQLTERLSTELGVTDQEWSSYSPKYGWSVKLKLKKRTILYLGPCSGCIRVSFVLGDRAMKAARDSRLSVSVLKAMDEARRYPEGTGLYLLVKTTREISSIVKLAKIKLGN
jgi:Protein of unknown function (DUF3788)